MKTLYQISLKDIKYAIADLYGYSIDDFDSYTHYEIDEYFSDKQIEEIAQYLGVK